MTGDDGGYKEGIDPLGRDTGDERVFVGFGHNPVWLGTRREKSRLFTQDFERIYSQWRRLHVGVPLETGDPEELEVITDLEWLYQNHYSAQARILENTAKAAAYLKAGFRLKER
jgi:hypothetical protein